MMRRMKSRLAAALMATAVFSPHPASAGEVRLIPGTPVEFEVPAAPPSLAHLYRQKSEPVRMSIQLPADYSPSRSYPVLVFLSGGDGGGGGELHMARPFLGAEGYVLCNFPLFKKNIAGATPDEQLSVTPLDADHALPALRLLLDELRRRVPNIDESRSVFAGFSNGANTAALILWSGDRDLISRFSTYILIEGGFWLGMDYDRWSGAKFAVPSFDSFADKRLLFVFGADENPPDRIPFIKDARTTIEVLREAGIDTAEWPMRGVGHDFPPHEMDAIRAWLLPKLR